MSIARLVKLTVYGITEQRRALLEALQGLGCMHLLPYRDPSPTSQQSAFTHQELTRAIRYLLVVQEKRLAARHAADHELADVVRRALAIQQELGDFQNQRDRLLKRIRDVEPWGNFELPPLEDLAGHRFWFYRVPHNKLQRISADVTYQVVARDNQNHWIVVLSADEPANESVPAARVRVGSLPLENLRARLEKIELRMDELALERQLLTRWLPLLIAREGRLEDREALRSAAQGTLDEGQFFAVSGFCPLSRQEEVLALAERFEAAVVVHEPEETEEVPTLLDHGQLTAPGRELVRFYSVPAYSSWDPSALVMVSFAAFFAMILSDVGYSLLLGAILFLTRKKFHRTATGRHLFRLGIMMVSFSVVYGVLVGSYFGVSPQPESIWGRAQLLNVQDFQGMMQLAIVVGAAHLVLANLAACYRALSRDGPAAALAPFGWSLIIGAGLAYWFLFQQTPSSPGVALYSGVAGAVLVLLFSSHRRWSAKQLPRRLLDGLLALTGLTSAFGDVLSYLRLFALGLASISLAVTFNQLASNAASLEGLGKFLALLILIFGHGINLLLALLGGVVHGLRLNLLEFFRWSDLGEGRPFIPFARKETQQDGTV